MARGRHAQQHNKQHPKLHHHQEYHRQQGSQQWQQIISTKRVRIIATLLETTNFLLYARHKNPSNPLLTKLSVHWFVGLIVLAVSLTQNCSKEKEMGMGEWRTSIIAGERDESQNNKIHYLEPHLMLMYPRQKIRNEIKVSPP